MDNLNNRTRKNNPPPKKNIKNNSTCIKPLHNCLCSCQLLLQYTSTHLQISYRGSACKSELFKEAYVNFCIVYVNVTRVEFSIPCARISWPPQKIFNYLYCRTPGNYILLTCHYMYDFQSINNAFSNL